MKKLDFAVKNADPSMANYLLMELKKDKANTPTNLRTVTEEKSVLA
jgi:hypothetical protein